MLVCHFIVGVSESSNVRGYIRRLNRGQLPLVHEVLLTYRLKARVECSKLGRGLLGSSQHLRYIGPISLMHDGRAEFSAMTCKPAAPAISTQVPLRSVLMHSIAAADDSYLIMQ